MGGLVTDKTVEKAVSDIRDITASNQIENKASDIGDNLWKQNHEDEDKNDTNHAKSFDGQRILARED